MASSEDAAKCAAGLAERLARIVPRPRDDPDARLRACAAVVLAANLGTAALIFTFTPFVTQIGLQFWFLAGALHGLAPGTGRSRT